MADVNILEDLAEWVQRKSMEYSASSLHDAESANESDIYFSMFCDLNFILKSLRSLSSNKSIANKQIPDSVSKTEFEKLKEEYDSVQSKLDHLEKLKIFQKLAKLETENNKLRKQLGMDEVPYPEMKAVRKQLLDKSHVHPAS